MTSVLPEPSLDFLDALEHEYLDTLALVYKGSQDITPRDRRKALRAAIEKYRTWAVGQLIAPTKEEQQPRTLTIVTPADPVAEGTALLRVKLAELTDHEFDANIEELVIYTIKLRLCLQQFLRGA